MNRIAFVIRNDGISKSAGDVDLAKQFGTLISEPGNIETAVVRFADLSVPEFDLIVLFNIDMPFESYLVARECVRLNIPYVIYTLHPKGGYVEDFLRHGTAGVQHLAAALAGFSLLKYETIACIARSARTKRWRQLLSYRTPGYAARYVLRSAARVLVSCTGEAEYVRRDFAAEARFEVMPHLVDEQGLARSSESAASYPRDPGAYVLCAGRIESRKNQMAVVEVAKAHPDIRFLFLGKKNRSHAQYIRDFETAVASHANMEWRDQVPLLELQKLICSARAYISLSWFEVFSLIDLMALVSQTPSILSTGSYLCDQIRSNGGAAGVDFVDPNDIATAGRQLSSLPRQATIARSAIMDESWTEAAIRKQWIKIVHDVRNGYLHAA